MSVGSERERAAVASMRSPRAPAVVLLLAATLVGGVIAYVLTWAIPRDVGFERYPAFAAFWSLLFLLIAGLSGIQQEVTRATVSADGSPGVRGTTGRFAAVASIGVVLLVGLSSPLWSDSVFPGHGWAFVPPLAIGAGSYVLVAVISGLLAGSREWERLFVVIVLEAVLRLVAVIIVLIVSDDLVLLAWVVALPWAATVLILWPAVRRRVAGRALDVGARRLAWNVLRTVLSATAVGLLVSGLPLLLVVAAAGVPATLLSAVILSITIVRAPIVVVAIALQSYLIVFFRDRAAHLIRWVLVVLLGIAVATTLLAVLTWAVGPAAFELLFPEEAPLSAGLLAAIMGSSALLGGMCVTGPALLSQGRHAANAAGWAVAALVTVVGLFLPLPFEQRVLLALYAGPGSGILVHGLCAVLIRARTR